MPRAKPIRIRKEDIPEIIKLYLQGLSSGDLSNIFSYRRTGIKEMLKRKGVLRTVSKAMSLAHKQGKLAENTRKMVIAAKTTNRFNPLKANFGLNHPLYRPVGSKSFVSRGNETYILIKINNQEKWMYEHRFVIANKIGRELLKDEVVHHVNGNGSDNRIENLMLTTSSEHNKIHHKKEEESVSRNK